MKIQVFCCGSVLYFFYFAFLLIKNSRVGCLNRVDQVIGNTAIFLRLKGVLDQNLQKKEVPYLKRC